MVSLATHAPSHNTPLHLSQGELAMTSGQLGVAQQCLERAKDYSGMLLMRRCALGVLRVLGIV